MLVAACLCCVAALLSSTSGYRSRHFYSEQQPELLSVCRSAPTCADAVVTCCEGLALLQSVHAKLHIGASPLPAQDVPFAKQCCQETPVFQSPQVMRNQDHVSQPGMHWQAGHQKPCQKHREVSLPVQNMYINHKLKATSGTQRDAAHSAHRGAAYHCLQGTDCVLGFNHQDNDWQADTMRWGRLPSQIDL